MRISSGCSVGTPNLRAPAGVFQREETSRVSRPSLLPCPISSQDECCRSRKDRQRPLRSPDRIDCRCSGRTPCAHPDQTGVSCKPDLKSWHHRCQPNREVGGRENLPSRQPVRIASPILSLVMMADAVTKSQNIHVYAGETLCTHLCRLFHEAEPAIIEVLLLAENRTGSTYFPRYRASSLCRVSPEYPRQSEPVCRPVFRSDHGITAALSEWPPVYASLASIAIAMLCAVWMISSGCAFPPAP